MCTQIATRSSVIGTAQAPGGWAPVDEAIVSFDHATHAWVEHALRLDFASTSDAAAHVAVELDLASGRALLDRLRQVLDEVDRAGLS